MSNDENETRSWSSSNTEKSRTRAYSSGESHSEGYSESLSFDDRDRKAFSELIALAERVQTQRDSLKRQILMALGGFAFIGIATTATLATVYDFSTPEFFLSTPAGILGIVIFLAAYAGTMYVYMQMSRRLRRENRAFEEVMNVVHEVFEGLKGQLSPLEIAETRIRLSRLDN